MHGGDLSEVFRLNLSDGQTVIAKVGSTAPVEAEMLRAIRATGAPAPDVVAVGESLLLLKDLGPDDGPARAWSDLGHSLRKLHAHTAETYGWSRDHAFGTVDIPNTPTTDWPEFWTKRRLLPSCPHIAPDLARRVETLASRIGEYLPPKPLASLLHGDLWTGNIMAQGSRVTGLIDPSCYYGHAEVDLAMLSLFGTPGPAFETSYGKLEEGHHQRRPIYQLWPALVHLRLFGSGYRSLVERCLDRF